MDEIKKFTKIFITGVFILSLFLTPIMTIDASFEGNEDYYSELCSTSSGYKDNKSKCDDFSDYLKKQREETDQLIKDLKNNASSISGNLKKDEAILKDVEKKITEISAEIKRNEREIAVLEDQIAKLVVEIEKSEAEIEVKKETAKNYMVNIQSSTRVNVFVDFLLAGEDFAEMSRRVEGMNRINEKNQDNIRELNVAKEKLEAAKKDIDFQTKYLEDIVKGQTIAVNEQKELQKLAEQRITLLRQQYAEMIASQEAAEQQKKLIVEKIGSIGPVESSSGSLERPLRSGYSVSAGLWNYSSGGKHLGVDLAAARGTPIYAPANGIVLYTRKDCPTEGSLSSNCGGGYGNSVLMIISSEGKTYGALYGHMQNGGVLVSANSKITKGQQIGRVGNSGRSTGAHVHAELFYLGTQSVQSAYDEWHAGSKNIQFGLGGSTWGNEYANRCDVNGWKANCRMNPQKYWGLY